MKKMISILLAALMLTMLCGCGAKNGPSSQTAPGAAQPTQSGAEGTQSQDGQSAPQASDSGIVKTGEEAENWDGLDVFGLPDLSGFTTEELWDMYVHPENWDSETLQLCDSDLVYAEEEPYSDPEVEDYVFDLGEWHDYDPGSWTPGPEVFYDYGDEEPQGSGGEDGGAQLHSGLPDEYAFLLPEGLREGDLAMEEDGTFVLNLKGRSADDFKAMVKRAKDAGYTKDATEMDMMGISMYEAGNGSETLTLMLQSGALLVSIE